MSFVVDGAAVAQSAVAADQVAAASELGGKHPTVSRAFDRVWDQFVPFLAFPPEVRRVI